MLEFIIEELFGQRMASRPITLVLLLCSTLNGDQSSPGVGGPVPEGFIDEDIYESLPQDEVQDGDVPLPMGSGTVPPNLPPPNTPNRFPPPTHAPPPPPGDGMFISIPLSPYTHHYAQTHT